MKALIINNNSDHIAQIGKLLELHEVTYEVSSYRNIGNIDNSKYSLAILSGGKDHHVEGNSSLSAEIRFIKTFGKPILGICFGFELIVTTFGGDIERQEDKITEILQLRITQPDEPLFQSMPAEIQVKESHYWTIKSLPDELEILAQSQYGPEIIKHTELAIYGFQFHPELLISQTQGDELFANWLQLATPQNYHVAS